MRNTRGGCMTGSLEDRYGGVSAQRQCCRPHAMDWDAVGLGLMVPCAPDMAGLAGSVANPSASGSPGFCCVAIVSVCRLTHVA